MERSELVVQRATRCSDDSRRVKYLVTYIHYISTNRQLRKLHDWLMATSCTPRSPDEVSRDHCGRP